MYTQTHILNKHAQNLPSSIQADCPVHLFMTASVCVCVWSAECLLFVSLIKADTVQSRGLRGEIKVLLLPRHGGAK